VKRRPPPTFDAFCREAVDFLTGASTPYLIIGGLAVAVIGEPRMTGDVDVIGYLSADQATVLIDAAVAAGFEVASDEHSVFMRPERCVSPKGGSISISSSRRCRSRTMLAPGRANVGYSGVSYRYQRQKT
jgi:hypothetical protein